MDELVARFMKWVWECVSMVFFCVGLGTAVATLAMADAGILPYFALLPILPGCGFLVWRSVAVRRKYLKWVRID